MPVNDFISRFLPLRDEFYRVAYYFLESEDDAADVVQDLYLKLWNNRDALEQIRNPKSYGITLVRNLCIDLIRRRRDTAGPPDDTLQDGCDIEVSLIEKERLRAAIRTIGELPPGLRKILKMKVIDELSYEEISGRTGINYLTLRVMVSQARRKLKKNNENSR